MRPSNRQGAFWCFRSTNNVLPTTTTTTARSPTRNSCCCISVAIIRKKRRRTLLILLVFLYCVHRLRRSYFELELAITDPYREAQVIWPWRYFQVKYLQRHPSAIRNFTMTAENAFVINVDSDTARYRSFRYHSGNATITRFSASTWTRNHNRSSEQEIYMHQYPWIQTSVRKKAFGDAACALSHIRLLEHFLDMDNIDYMFVFEDDAIFDKRFLETRSIRAPNDAQAILLSKTSTKLVEIPIKHHQKYATRVIQGFGMFGFVITKEGAKRLLQIMQRRGDAALDVVLNSRLLTYHPIDYWPLVHHADRPSTRRKVNDGLYLHRKR